MQLQPLPHPGGNLNKEKMAQQDCVSSKQREFSLVPASDSGGKLALQKKASSQAREEGLGKDEGREERRRKETGRKEGRKGNGRAGQGREGDIKALICSLANAHGVNNLVMANFRLSTT